MKENKKENNKEDDDDDDDDDDKEEEEDTGSSLEEENNMKGHLFFSTFPSQSLLMRSQYSPLSSMAKDMKQTTFNDDDQSDTSHNQHVFDEYDRILATITGTISPYRLKHPNPVFNNYLIDSWHELNTLVTHNVALRNNVCFEELLRVGKVSFLAVVASILFAYLNGTYKADGMISTLLVFFVLQ
jgi:hypothetical protein